AAREARTVPTGPADAAAATPDVSDDSPAGPPDRAPNAAGTVPDVPSGTDTRDASSEEAEGEPEATGGMRDSSGSPGAAGTAMARRTAGTLGPVRS
ncbi:hypothetical protein ACWD25_49255, partial [Streptomyces sp. NPDC002920]